MRISSSKKFKPNSSYQISRDKNSGILNVWGRSIPTPTTPKTRAIYNAEMPPLDSKALTIPESIVKLRQLQKEIALPANSIREMIEEGRRF
ncbi:MAG: hypothetical protein ACO3EZ_09155 [Prochlorotrichaceae cyanobacterium]|jgi:hypothetical protein